MKILNYFSRKKMCQERILSLKEFSDAINLINKTDFLNELFEKIRTHFNPDLIRYYTFDRDSRECELSIMWPKEYKSPNDIDICSKKITSGLLGQSFKNKTTLIHTLSKSTNKTSDWINIDDRIFSKVIIPVIYNNDFRGVFFLDFHHKLSSLEEKTFEIVGNLVTHATFEYFEYLYREKRLLFLQKIPNIAMQGIDNILAEYFSLFNEIFGVKLLNLWIYQKIEEMEFLILRASYPAEVSGSRVKTSDYDNTIMDLKQCLTGEVIEKKDFNIYYNLKTNKKFQNRELALTHDIDWCLSFPIFSNNQPLGVFNYTPLVKKEEFMGQTNTINNIKQFLQMFEIFYRLLNLNYNKEIIENFYSIFASLFEFGDNKLSWDKLAQSISGIMNSEACSIFISDSPNQIVLKGSTGIEGETDYNKIRYKENEGLTGLCFASGKPILYLAAMRKKLQHIAHAHISKFREILISEGKSKSIIFIPMIDRNNKIFGVIRCNNKCEKFGVHYDQFTNEDIILLENISKLISNEFVRINEISANIKRQTKERESNIFSLHHELLAPIDGLKSHAEFFIHKIKLKRDIEIVDQVNSKQTATLPRSFIPKFEDILQNAHLINNLVYSMGDLDNVKCSFSPFDLVECVRDCFYVLKNELNSNNIEYNIPYMPIPKYYNGDKLLLMRVFYNIIRNSLKYADNRKSKKYIKCSAEEKNNFIFLYMEDNGIGVEKGDEFRVFKKFERGFNARSFFPEGTGIGLTYCAEIIKKHGGTIRFSNLKNPTILELSLKINP